MKSSSKSMYVFFIITNHFSKFHNRRAKCTSTAMHMAAVNGHIEVVRFLHENRTEGCREDTMGEVAKNHKKELDIPANSMNLFAFYKDSSALQWFKDNTTLQCSESSYRYAIRQANLPIIEWIRDNTRLPFPKNALYLSSSGGNSDLRIVQYLLDNGVAYTESAMDNCPKLSIFEYLHFNRSEGCSSEALANVIENENVSIIKFHLQNRTEHLDSNYSLYYVDIHKTFDYPSRLKLIKQYNL
ncbi:hypothetical protein PPL_10918 [Heterostelium album PN500]|uniref:Ankyrin repeat protein n=1 Tax=Heterostelium pallidum (strain ATCC 26659 / Pp 5 / PN500) TaxID=670386 RepID=D3BSF1_HETP5|nr:hypothetical protein PPL_10918 [Heterostelium album PN500]EFA75657.1 hypothetical protein PPL_10918 [Heterostelium album PN500]|eukprot:XP_020427791.1 hypothetical protein PPL_10918 [Heterostelium album PN500]